MAAVFVHGVPETGRLWDRLRALLSTNPTALELPEFSVPRPAGFGAPLGEYVESLESEIQGIDGPVDLVGHDWGAVLVARAATKSSVVVRSWAVDEAGVLHPAYVWHDLAKLWQAPGAGEQWAKTAVEAAVGGSPEDATARYFEAGVSAEDAVAMVERLDATMADCMLDLYRSATPNPHPHWGTELSAPTSTPGLVIQPLLDPYDDPVASGEMAARLGAHTQRLDGVGHWWMLQDPSSAADALERFWISVSEG
jgi:pimeloyl-ACP methyl ester carboxylesterase